MLGRITGAVRFKEPLSYHTSLRIGGPAEFFVAAQDIDDVRHTLAFADQEDLPVIMLGGGNNMLVSDRGVQAVVLKLQGVLGRVQFQGSEVVAGAGVTVSGLIREAAARDLGGLEAFAGIPATLGGAVATTARGATRTFEEACVAVYFLYPDGTLGEYRPLPGSSFAEACEPGCVVIGCRFDLPRRPQAEITKDIQQRLKSKKATQPFALASAGYVWKRTPAEEASRLVERAGLRGKRVNSAEISPKNGNIIVNRGGASASDILRLMDLMRETVHRRFGVDLETEIRMFGFAPAYAPRERLALA